MIKQAKIRGMGGGRSKVVTLRDIAEQLRTWAEQEPDPNGLVWVTIDRHFHPYVMALAQIERRTRRYALPHDLLASDRLVSYLHDGPHAMVMPFDLTLSAKEIDHFVDTLEALPSYPALRPCDCHNCKIHPSEAGCLRLW